MHESFLHFIWRYQYFDKQALVTTTGQPATILDPGIPNNDAGPDFAEARIKLEDIQWVGDVEIHIKSSYWHQHLHQNDPAYDEIVLHVVWQDDQPLWRKNGVKVPTIELQDRVAHDTILRLSNLTHSARKIGCHGQYNHPSSMTAMLQRTFIQRMTGMEQRVTRLLHHLNFDWDLVTYRVLGRNFGFRTNSGVFEDLVKAVPLATVRRMSSRVLQLEALFFGQAGMLVGNSHDRYFCRLQEEYQFLIKMFPCLPKPISGHRWKFLRMRPANFPTVRIAQFVQLMHRHGYRFTLYRELTNWQPLPQLLAHQCLPYWKNHFRFHQTTAAKSSVLGSSGMANVAINSLVPLQLAYFRHVGDQDGYKQCLERLKSLPAEQNRLTRYWKENGFKVTSAYHSQALLALNRNYCKLKNCLDCTIGQALIKGKAS